jgi:ribosomal protein L1
MDEDAFNLSIRKFLKHFGVTAQREIESSVRKAIEEGRLRGDEAVPVRATLLVDGILRDYHIDGTVTLSASPDAPAAT